MSKVTASIVCSVLLLICSVLLFIDGYKSYRYQRVTKRNPKLDRDRLVDIKGYTQWYGKRMMALGIIAFVMFIIGWVSCYFKTIDFLFTFCLLGNFIVSVTLCWQNATKLDRFYGEKQDL